MIGTDVAEAGCSVACCWASFCLICETGTGSSCEFTGAKHDLKVSGPEAISWPSNRGTDFGTFHHYNKNYPLDKPTPQQTSILLSLIKPY